ncbi:Uu.00g135400.m01.CDS01 [Anthostomella pinea]|uniref:Uu.00g135400.m01.CDS01 n=1 Tax=Anthostomella pinea TaxID=933095 RepID=A0AAI8VIP6_9PEZI|nr:Uu.00g135400.m01.CDS01 [Anthostomella pinea]
MADPELVWIGLNAILAVFASDNAEPSTGTLGIVNGAPIGHPEQWFIGKPCHAEERNAVKDPFNGRSLANHVRMSKHHRADWSNAGMFREFVAMEIDIKAMDKDQSAFIEQHNENTRSTTSISMLIRSESRRRPKRRLVKEEEGKSEA